METNVLQIYDGSRYGHWMIMAWSRWGNKIEVYSIKRVSKKITTVLLSFLKRLRNRRVHLPWPSRPLTMTVASTNPPPTVVKSFPNRPNLPVGVGVKLDGLGAVSGKLVDAMVMVGGWKRFKNGRITVKIYS